MELTADLVYGFTQSLLLKRFDDPKPTPKFHYELWELACLPDPKVAIAAPRGHAKSTAITHSFLLAAMLFRYRDFALIVSDTEGQAVQFLHDVKKELQENDELINLFGVTKFIKDSETDCIVQFKDGVQFRIIVKGSEQKLRGTKWRNRRPNLILGDDLENDEIVENEERRAKFRRWFWNALLPCGSDNCLYRIVGTILHLDSALERLMPPIGHEMTIDTPLRSYSRDFTRTWTSIRYRAHSPSFKEILWESKFPEVRLRAIRQDYIDQGFPEGYSQEYLNYPIDESLAFFRKQDLMDLDPDYEKTNGECYAAADLAISEKDQRAYTVFAVARLTPDNRLQVVDIRRARMDSLEIIDELFSIQEAYEPVLFIVEQENIARALGSVIYREMDVRNIYVNLEPVVPGVDKLIRARALQARTRARKVEFDKESDWWPELYQEMLTFPKGKYKDQVDALSWIAKVLDKMPQVSTMEELEEDEYQQELEEWKHDSPGSVNWVTGY